MRRRGLEPPPFIADQALNLVTGVSDPSYASISSRRSGDLDGMDAMDDLDVATDVATSGLAAWTAWRRRSTGARAAPARRGARGNSRTATIRTSAPVLVNEHGADEPGPHDRAVELDASTPARHTRDDHADETRRTSDHAVKVKHGRGRPSQGSGERP